MNHQRAWAEVNLAHISHNFHAIKARTNSPIMGIVKADGYGHGAVPVAQTLVSGGADMLGVAVCEEGVALRESGITCPILIMGFTPEHLLPEIVHHNLVQTIFSPAGAELLAKQADGKRATVHIKIDTGMSRLGFLPNPESINAICEIASDPRLNIEGIFTHCATSDKADTGFFLEQQARFDWVLSELSKRGLNFPLKHMENSGAIVQTFCNGFTKRPKYDVVRPGIMLYGYPPSPEIAGLCADLELKPAMRLLAQVSMVKEFPAGTGISYGHTFVTARPSTIAVLTIGYADGYPRRLSNKGQVLIRQKLAPIAGTICMDQCMVDVTDIPNVQPGDIAVLLGSTQDGICADSLGNILGTISYEILCSIGKRVPRIYV